MTTYLLGYLIIGCTYTLIASRIGLLSHMCEWVEDNKLGAIGIIMLLYAFIILWPVLVGMYIFAFIKSFIKELRNRGYLK
jgi:hypothetical protein